MRECRDAAGSLPLADARARHLPWFLVNLGVAAKGRGDCGAHEFCNADGTVEHCYHCEVGERRTTRATSLGAEPLERPAQVARTSSASFAGMARTQVRMNLRGTSSGSCFGQFLVRSASLDRRASAGLPVGFIGWFGDFGMLAA